MSPKRNYTKRNKNKIEDDLQESKKRSIKTEKELRNSEENYRLLFDGMEEGFCIVEVLFDENQKPFDYRFLEVNPAFEKQTGLINAVGKRMREFAPEHEGYWFEIYGKVALTGQPVRFQNHAKQLNRWYAVNAYRVGNPEKRHVAIIFSDISDQKNRESEAIERATELEAILSCITDGVLVYDKNGKIIRSNSAGNDLINFQQNSLERTISQRFSDGLKAWSLDGHPLKPEETPSLRAAIKGETVKDCIIKVQGKGEPKWMNVSAAPLLVSDKQIGAVVSMSDITEKKKSEEALKERLREKESLVKEIFHRTKNNMQVISSMLVLKTSGLPDPKVQDIIADILDRIRAMALVHEKLIDRNDLSKVNLKEYIIELADSLLHDQVKDDKVIMKYDLEEIDILLDVAVPCGLILTELILNSIKYAFPGNMKGYIEIKLRRDEDRTIELIVADNGIGFIESDIDNADKMGLQLLKVIAESQLNAFVDMKVDNGVIWTLKFKDVLYKERV